MEKRFLVVGFNVNHKLPMERKLSKGRNPEK